MKIEYILGIALVFLVALNFVSGADNVLMGFQGYYLNNSDNSTIDTGTLDINISTTNTCDGEVYNETFTDKFYKGIADVMLGVTYPLPMEYGNQYYICTIVNGEQVSLDNFTSSTGEIEVADIDLPDFMNWLVPYGGATANVVLGANDITANNLNINDWNTAFGWGDPSLTYVPYLGATGSVDLGSNNLETTGTLSAGQTSGDLAHFEYLRLDGNLEQFLGSMQTLRINATFINASENIMFDKDLIGGASFRVNSTTNTTSTRHIYPMEDNISDIGWVGESSALRFRNIYMDGVFSNALGDTVSLRELDDLEKNALTTRWLQGTPSYLYNDTTSLYFNETKLNETFQNWTEAQGFGAGGLWTNDSNTARYDAGNINITNGNAIINGSVVAIVHHRNWTPTINRGSNAFGFQSYTPFPIFPSLTGMGSIISSGLGSIAIGYANSGLGINTTIESVGQGSMAGGYSGAGHGDNISSSGKGSFTWGAGSSGGLVNEQIGGVNMGAGNTVNGSDRTGGVALGVQNTVSASYGVALGYGNNLWQNANFGAVALGTSNTVTNQYSQAIGYGNTNTHSVTTILGRQMASFSGNTVMFGYQDKFLMLNGTGLYTNETGTLSKGLTANYDMGGGCYFNISGGLIVGSNCSTL